MITQPGNVTITEREAALLCNERKTAFTPTYWMERIQNAAHFDFVLSVKVPPDYRLLYDS